MVHVNKHRAAGFTNKWHTKKLGKPNLFPHGAGHGLPKAVPQKKSDVNHAYEEKLRVRHKKFLKRKANVKRKMRSLLAS